MCRALKVPISWTKFWYHLVTKRLSTAFSRWTGSFLFPPRRAESKNWELVWCSSLKNTMRLHSPPFNLKKKGKKLFLRKYDGQRQSLIRIFKRKRTPLISRGFLRGKADKDTGQKFIDFHEPWRCRHSPLDIEKVTQFSSWGFATNISSFNYQENWLPDLSTYGSTTASNGPQSFILFVSLISNHDST